MFYSTRRGKAEYLIVTIFHKIELPRTRDGTNMQEDDFCELISLPRGRYNDIIKIRYHQLAHSIYSPMVAVTLFGVSWSVVLDVKGMTS